MEKIGKLKDLMLKHGLDGYIIPKNDEFFTEYVPNSKDKLNFISNFSGSYGFAVILKKKNYLFVDGRYTLQAKAESGKKFEIVTIPNKYPYQVLKIRNFRIGFNPKIHTSKTIKTIFDKSKCHLVSVKQDLIDKIWNQSDKEIKKKFFVLPKSAISKDYKFKIKKLIKNLIKKKIDLQLVTSSENIAWLLNIRGHDSEFTPLPQSYICFDKYKNINFFCDLKKIDKNFKRKFKDIKFIDIRTVDNFLFRITNKKISIDSTTCSIYFENILKKKNKIVETLDPTYYLKSIKSKTEIRNTIQSHIYDGVALTKFLFWVKKNYKKKKLSEISAQNKLLMFRKKNKSFKFLSFPTISGSGPNGAIIHYKANSKTNRILKNGDIYLVDSGGQYNYGTTDVTRTISLNNTDKNIRDIYTRVLKGHIAVASYKIKSNTAGSQIDKVARNPLKKIGLNYPHGTGHGVGCFLNVHEGPQAISKNNLVHLKEGMILSNEPGYYSKGKFGIRIENLITVKKNKKGFYFENLTMAPIDKTLIDKTSLQTNEINWLNEYHKKVFQNLKKYMNKNEALELKLACSNI